MIRCRPLPTKAALAIALLAAACGVQAQVADPAAVTDRPELALMGTIPIYWGEADEFADLLNGGGEAHWARARLEAHYTLQPLDSLSAETLGRYTRLLMAQPRTLSPAENVALDAWVRGGGRLLLLADPLMTGESRFGIGDRRRPQDATFITPVLAHWGLDLAFDDSRHPALVMADADGLAVPVNLAGQLSAREGGACTVIGTHAVAARCRLGAGEVLVIADAAMLDHAGPWPGAPEALESLLARLFGDFGETVHQSGIRIEQSCENNLLLCWPNGDPERLGGSDPPS